MTTLANVLDAKMTAVADDVMIGLNSEDAAGGNDNVGTLGSDGQLRPLGERIPWWPSPATAIVIGGGQSDMTISDGFYWDRALSYTEAEAEAG